MASADSDFAVTLSVIDRLMDREPQLASDPQTTRAQTVRELKKNLRRDMEWLLNTRRNPDAVRPDSMEQLAQSLYNYGLPDFTALSIYSLRDRGQLMVELESTIALFEPRLRDVRVTLVETPDGPSRILHFQIEGLLDMDPAPEAVSFDTTLQLASGEYEIRGERGA
jgi:type VI secretion system protein ImpF